MISKPSRETLLKAVEQIADTYALVVEDRVPGKCVCVEWPTQVNSNLTFDKEAVRVLRYLEQERARGDASSS